MRRLVQQLVETTSRLRFCLWKFSPHSHIEILARPGPRHALVRRSADDNSPLRHSLALLPDCGGTSGQAGIDVPDGPARRPFDASYLPRHDLAPRRSLPGTNSDGILFRTFSQIATVNQYRLRSDSSGGRLIRPWSSGGRAFLALTAFRRSRCGDRSGGPGFRLNRDSGGVRGRLPSQL